MSCGAAVRLGAVVGVLITGGSRGPGLLVAEWFDSAILPPGPTEHGIQI